MSRSAKLQSAVDHLVSVVMELREVEKGDDTGLCLGELIQAQREAWGLSLQGLADKVEMSKGHLWDMEQGKTTNPTAKAMLALAEALVIPPIHILNAAARSQRLLENPTPRTQT